MKAFTKLLFVAFVAIIGLVSCDKQSVLPTIEIKSVGSTENSIVFTISAKDASQIAYMCNTEGFDNISADKIMRDGVATTIVAMVVMTTAQVVVIMVVIMAMSLSIQIPVMLWIS